MSKQPRTNHLIYSRLAIEAEGFDSLAELALDLRWSWNHAADEVWQRLDPALWELTHNPWVVLQTVSREQIDRVSSDPVFRKCVEDLVKARREEAKTPAWFQKNHAQASLNCVAYFSMEYMLSEALPIYSGGLGNVAGDQLKSASDLGVPVIGVGLLYQQGYFRQVIDKDGAQQALFPYNDPGQLKTDYIDREPAQKESQPTGPLRQGGEGRQGSLLIFVPRNAISALINDMTGGYGYSHLAIDCGEVDVSTGKRVMVESTPGLGVHNSFQDEYGERKFVRIPLEKAGVNAVEFCDCIRSKLGEKYDDGEALTLGLFDNPAKQICSDLAMVCLPEAMRNDLARRHRAGFLRFLAAVHLYGSLNETLHLFVSPNGFAEYFGAPKGEQLNGPDQLSDRSLATSHFNGIERRHRAS